MPTSRVKTSHRETGLRTRVGEEGRYVPERVVASALVGTSAVIVIHLINSSLSGCSGLCQWLQRATWGSKS